MHGGDTAVLPVQVVRMVFGIRLAGRFPWPSCTWGGCWCAVCLQSHPSSWGSFCTSEYKELSDYPHYQRGFHYEMLHHRCWCSTAIWIKVLFHLRGSCPPFFLQQSLLCASHGHCQWMDNLCSICFVPEGLGTEFNRASQQLQAKLFDPSLATPKAALPSSPPPPTETSRAWAEAILNDHQPSLTVCQHGWQHAGKMRAMQHRTSPLRGELLLSCLIPFPSLGKKPKFTHWLGCSHSSFS